MQTVPGLNIQKAGSDPVLAPDSEYPAWVADLAKPPLKLTEVRRAWHAEEHKEDWEVAEVNREVLEKLVRFENRARIKAKNSAAGTFGG